MKKILIFLTVALVGACALASCSSQKKEDVTNVEPKESPAPEADKVAKKTLEAVLDKDYFFISENSTEAYKESLYRDSNGDPNFSGNTPEILEEDGPLTPGTYKKIMNEKDYLYGAYYGFKNSHDIVLYYFSGILDGEKKDVQFSLKKEGSNWKISGYNEWLGSWRNKKSDGEIKSLINEGKDKNVMVFHRGESYKSR